MHVKEWTGLVWSPIPVLNRLGAKIHGFKKMKATTGE